ncbi:FUSC family protein [Azotobacter armeniacus]
MLRFLPSRHQWTAAPSWGAAIVASLGCALPLLLGLFSGHSGFLWASIGAFLAAQADPLHRFGMLRMLLLTLLGACSAGLGFWSAPGPLESLLVFAAGGLLLAWLQRFGREAGKLGLGMLVCLCLGQGQQPLGSMPNPYAVATLFTLGGLWVTLLAFSLRGLHGLRLWPYMPCLSSVLKVLRHHAARLPQPPWRLYALGCTLVCGLAGLIVNLAGQPRGYWLTLAVVTGLQIDLKGRLLRALKTALAALLAAGLLVLVGHGLQSPAQLVALVLPLILLNRAFQVGRYSLYVLQMTFCILLLAESLAQDWQLSRERLLGSLIGVLLALLVALTLYIRRRLRDWRAARSRTNVLPR